MFSKAPPKKEVKEEVLVPFGYEDIPSAKRPKLKENEEQSIAMYVW